MWQLTHYTSPFLRDLLYPGKVIPMQTTQRLQIECGAHGARPRVLASAVDRRHVSAEDARAIQNRHVRLAAALLPGRAVPAPAVRHSGIVLERMVMRDRRGAADRTPDWRRPGGKVTTNPAGWILSCPEVGCAPVALPTAAVAAALDNGMKSLDISDSQRV